MTARLPTSHPRAIAYAPAMTAGERAAIWPQGIDVHSIEKYERERGIKSSASQASRAPAATSQRSIDTGFGRAPGGAVRGSGGGSAPPSRAPSSSAPAPAPAASATTAAPTVNNPLALAAASVVAAFNKKWS